MSKTGRGASRELSVLVGCVAALALAVLAAGVVHTAAAGTWTSLLSWRAASVVLMILLAERLIVGVRIRSEGHFLSATNAAILVAATYIPWNALLLTTLVGVLGATLLMKLAPIKVVFNTSKEVLVAAAAALAGGFVLGPVFQGN
ncbi:MAG TPA: hypothetical protein VHA75_18620, partial [Rugosimonospora sp.]|nr:hypothetical protein [Rugosimonospora sp.]